MIAREVFCDSLTWRSALALARSAPARVRVLDDIRPGLASALLRKLLALFRCEVVETTFFAGHLRGEDGETLFTIATRRASAAALEAASAAVSASPRLAAINEAFGGDRLILRLSRQYWLPLVRQYIQVHVARALAGPNDVLLWLARPTRYDPRVLNRVLPGVEVHCYEGVSSLLERVRLLAWVLALTARTAAWRWVSRFSRPPARLADPHGRPGVLLVQEDPVSSDHSYRAQPHWFPSEGWPRLPFATYLLEGGATPSRQPGDIPADLTLLSERTLGSIDSHVADDALTAELRSAAQRCLGHTVMAPHDWLRTAFAVASRMLTRAAVFAKVCRFLDVRVFLSGETYLFDSDAIHAIAERTGVTTITFQYSNLAFGNVIAATTSDRMLVFSDRYAHVWPHGGFAARHFIAIGYPYDAAFDRVRERAREHRRGLEEAGARFVVCYFDENVGPPKYGFFAPDDLDGEIRTLARRVLDDPQLGVIFKSQFRKRSPSVRLAADPVLHAAKSTGRMIDLCVGSHRNVVLPAEAALASDIAIGHAVGATAALESALAGTPCVLINSNGLKTVNDELYSRGHVIYESFDEALEAIARLRAGDPELRSLGDWSAFIGELDPFRDGCAAQRLREVLEATACGRALSTTARSDESQAAHG